MGLVFPGGLRRGMTARRHVVKPQHNGALSPKTSGGKHEQQDTSKQCTS